MFASLLMSVARSTTRSAIGARFEVEVLTELTRRDRATVEAFERGIAEIPEVTECRRMVDVPDYIVRVAVADAEAYEAFYMSSLAELPAVGRVNWQVAMKLVRSA